MIVVDASVIVKCYQLEQDSDRAMLLVKSNLTMLAPELLRVEVSSGICKRVRSGEMKAEDALVRCRQWQQHLESNAIHLVNNHDLMPEAEKLSVDLKHALPDCLYLALAKREKVSLITADEVFTKKARSEYPEIVLLPELTAFE